MMILVRYHCKRNILDDDEYMMWDASTRLYWTTLPMISSFSGMKLLQFMQPWVLSTDISMLMHTYTGNEQLIRWVQFVIYRFVALFLGLDMFLLKFRDAMAFVGTTDFTLSNVMGAFVFMRQVLGILDTDVL